MNMDISIVIPLYNSGPRVALLYQSLMKILTAYSDYEIIFIDDGSKDNTAGIVKVIIRTDPHVRLIQLGKNMGQYAALSEGYKSSRGKIVISMDDDAFEESKYLPEFIKRIEEGYDAVFGWRKKTGYPLVRKGASFLFNLVLSVIIGKRLHDIGSPIKARNRKVVDNLISLAEPKSFLQYYKFFKIIEIRIQSSYSKSLPTRYNFMQLAKAGVLILRYNIFKAKNHLQIITSQSV
jgi:glycosyltransferase involved in cell wall biosynthesis